MSPVFQQYWIATIYQVTKRQMLAQSERSSPSECNPSQCHVSKLIWDTGMTMMLSTFKKASCVLVRLHGSQADLCHRLQLPRVSLCYRWSSLSYCHLWWCSYRQWTEHAFQFRLGRLYSCEMGDLLWCLFSRLLDSKGSDVHAKNHRYWRLHRFLQHPYRCEYDIQEILHVPSCPCIPRALTFPLLDLIARMECWLCVYEFRPVGEYRVLDVGEAVSGEVFRWDEELLHLSDDE